MNTGARIARIGKRLRSAALIFSGDFNEGALLAHCALMRLLRDDPNLSAVDGIMDAHVLSLKRIGRLA